MKDASPSSTVMSFRARLFRTTAVSDAITSSTRAMRSDISGRLRMPYPSSRSPPTLEEDRFTERLRGNGAGEGADPADSPSLLDQGDPLVKLGGLDGGGLARRTAADDEKVEVVGFAHRHSLTAGGRYESGSALESGNGVLI